MHLLLFTIINIIADCLDMTRGVREKTTRSTQTEVINTRIQLSIIQGYLFFSGIKICAGICLGDVQFMMCTTNSTQQLQAMYK